MSEPLSAVDPRDLSLYLASQGWQRQGLWRGAMIWRRESAGQVLIPDRLEYQDDEELLQQAVRTLAEFEERTEQEVLLDVTEPLTDTQMYRLHPDGPSGTIPLPSALRAMQGIHDLLKVSAQTTEQGPRLLFTGRRSGQVDNFLKQVKMGSSRPGSYVFHARVPVVRASSQDSLWDDSPLAGRDILLTMYKALDAARTAASAVVDGYPLSVFDEYVEQGVSANLCTALGNLGGMDKSDAFDITFSWARARPIDPPGPLRFSGPMARALARAGGELQKFASVGRATVVGLIETLRRGDSGDEWQVKIQGSLTTETGQFRRGVWVLVNAANYQRAFHAQIRKRSIRVTGRLVPAPRRLELQPDEDGIEILERWSFGIS